MAEAFAKLYGKHKVQASSAGIMPAEKVNSTVVQALLEKGIDVSANQPKMLTQKMLDDAELVFTMGCGAEGVCMGPLKRQATDWKLEDPKGQPIEKVREIRDEIERRVIVLLQQIE